MTTEDLSNRRKYPFIVYAPDMDILVLGGTAFVGRAVVDALIGRGHTPTLFSRGVTGADLFPEVGRLAGDRNTGDYASLADGSWDAVVDVTAYVPRQVGQASEALRGRVGRYLFISTCAVYDHQRERDGSTEDAPLLPAHRETEDAFGPLYGALKVACEEDVHRRWGERGSIIRPGVVAGPHDISDRFTYWTRQAAHGGAVEVPGRLDQPVQVVDVRDLASLVLALLENDQPGVFNAVGPREPVTLQSMITIAAAALGSSVSVVEVEHQPGLPLVLPTPALDVTFRRSAAAAYAAGMTATPLAKTAVDVRAWDQGRGEPELDRRSWSS